MSNLAGATFGAFEASSNSTDTSGATPIETCTTDASGYCHMLVPTRGGGSGSDSAGYLVREISAPAGYRTIERYNVSSSGLSVTDTYNYRYYTGRVGPTRSSGQRTFTFPTQGSGLSLSSGTWANSRVNPALPAQCGLNVALLIDLSTSVGGNISYIRSAGSGLVRALEGTPSQVAVHTFSTRAPASGANNANMGLRSVATAAGAQAVVNKVNGLTIPSGTQYTNWDSGLWGLMGMASDLDAVLMLTDGVPTRYGPNGDGAGTSRLIEVENAIASANAIKAAGVPVIAVGVGSGVSGAADNLINISGPRRGGEDALGDYYQVNWDALADSLRALASQNCDGTVTLIKEVVPVGGGEPVVRSNWNFTASAPGPTIRLDANPTDPFATSVTGTTNAGGAVAFLSDFSGTTAADRRMTVTEVLEGYDLVQQGGFNARCTLDGQPVPVTNAGSAASPGFTVDPVDGRNIACVVRNQELDTTAQLRVDKVWSIDLGDGQGPVVYDPNDAPTLIPGLGARLVLGGNTGLPGGSHSFGTVYPNLELNSTVTISEEVTGLPPLCTYTATFAPTLGADSSLTLTIPSDEGINEVTITNAVVCESKLTLEKQVDGPNPVAATNWTLQALAQGSAMTFGEGTSGITHPVTPGAVYPLAETLIADPDPRAHHYVQTLTPTDAQGQWQANQALGATGSWTCVEATGLDANDQPVWGTNWYDGRNGGVTVKPGQWSRCTAINQTAEITLLKYVVNDDGGTRVPADWTLTATPAAAPAVPGLAPQPVLGASSPNATNTFSVRPGHGYTLSESESPGYQQVAIQRYVGDNPANPNHLVEADWEAVTQPVSVEVLDHDIFRFVNGDLPGSVAWTKVDAADDRLGGSEWLLTGPGLPAEGLAITDCVAADATGCTGPDRDHTAGGFRLEGLDWGTYQLTETKAPAGYFPHGDPISFTVSGSTLNPELEPVVNIPRTPPPLPHTGGIGRDFFALTGTGVLLAGLVLIGVGRFGSRREEVA
ncbi:MAG: SpaA isopeptide-forming pilin-related protein [bacterium]|nr:SpaA isopeptide-forming pilin-related protein [bacterium]